MIDNSFLISPEIYKTNIYIIPPAAINKNKLIRETANWDFIRNKNAPMISELINIFNKDLFCIDHLKYLLETNKERIRYNVYEIAFDNAVPIIPYIGTSNMFDMIFMKTTTAIKYAISLVFLVSCNPQFM